MKVFISILLFSISFNSTGQVIDDSIISSIAQRIDSMPNGFVLSIAILKDEEVNYIGLIKENDSIRLKNLQDSLFEIGSLTKVFTTTLLAHEVVLGKLNINESINKSFPYKFNNKIKITYGELANHTSGLYRLPSNILPLLLKNPTNPYQEYSYSMFDFYLKEELQVEQSNPPKYSYSNLGAGLLAYALSKKRADTFSNLLRNNIFNQLNMTSTSFDCKPSYNGINANNEPAENWQFNALKGAGGLISSTSDLSKFVAVQFDTSSAVFSLTRKPTHSISDHMSIALGWHIIKSRDSPVKYWHNGGTGGFTSSISFRTTNRTGVIVLSNISALHQQSFVIDELCFELLDALNASLVKNMKK